MAQVHITHGWSSSSRAMDAQLLPGIPAFGRHSPGRGADPSPDGKPSPTLGTGIMFSQSLAGAGFCFAELLLRT